VTLIDFLSQNFSSVYVLQKDSACAPDFRINAFCTASLRTTGFALSYHCQSKPQRLTSAQYLSKVLNALVLKE